MIKLIEKHYLLTNTQYLLMSFLDLGRMLFVHIEFVMITMPNLIQERMLIFKVVNPTLEEVVKEKIRLLVFYYNN